MSVPIDKSGSPSHDEKSNTIKKEVEVCMVTWELDDHIDELDEILRGVSVAAIDQQLVKYVTDNIEPTGWQAVWRTNRNASSDTIKQQTDFIVDVSNVSQMTLNATVFLNDIVNDPEDKEKIENILNCEVSVPLIELYPTAYQENDAIDIQMTTAVIQQLRFFFLHIWQPWDSFEEVCCYTKSLISSRMKIYHQIKNEVIPPSVSSEMATLKQRAKKTADEIHKLEATLLADELVDQQDVVQLMKLNKEVEQLKRLYEAFGDPFLRELSLLQEQLERKDLVVSCSSEEPANVLVVASSIMLEDFVKKMTELPEILKTLPQSPDVSRVKTFPSLQMALDSAKVGDIIALLKGTHILKHLGPIAGGGIICGIGSGVSIVGSPATGDVLLHLRLAKQERFILQSVELCPLEFQTGILLHTGRMVIQQCTITGGSVGVCLLSESACRVEDSSFTNVDLVGLQCKSDSELVVGRSRFEKCQAALQSEERAKIIVNGKISISDCSKEMIISNTGGSSVAVKQLNNKILTVKGGKINIADYDSTLVTAA